MTRRLTASADFGRLESNLKGGKQSSDKGRENLEYGVSITDACVDWEMTLDILDNLNQVRVVNCEIGSIAHCF